MILHRPAPRASRRHRSLRLAGALGLAAGLFALGAAFGDHATAAFRQARWLLRDLTLDPAVPVAGVDGGGTQSERPEAERLYLRIRWPDRARLERKRREALELGVLVTGDDDAVPAWIGRSPETELLRARVRLKGDWTDHLRGDRWSFRVQLKGDGRLFGMKTFSLQAPERRNGIHEWIFHRALERERLVALRYRFVRVLLNGADLGIHAVEEHFDARLLEHNGFRDGPIVAFDESLHWEVEAGIATPAPGAVGALAAGVRPFGRAAVAAPGPRRDAFLRAASLLAGFVGGELAAAEVFDLEKVGLYNALGDLLGGYHGLRWGNLRFYMNPITGRLEPVGFDADAGQVISEPSFGQPRVGLVRLWRDTGFRRAYFGALERLAEPSYLDRLFADLDPELSSNVALLAAAGGDDMVAIRQIYAGNRQVLDAFLQPSHALRAHLAAAVPAAAGRQEIAVETLSFGPLPLEAAALERPGAPSLVPTGEAILEARSRGPMRVDALRFEVPAAAAEAWRTVDGATLVYRVPGTSREARTPLVPWPAPHAGRVPPDLLRQASTARIEDLAAWPFLRFEDDPPRVRVLPGTWRVDRPLVVPAGTALVAGPGVTLDLVAGASILSRSPLELRGRRSALVTLISSDGTGGGVLVLDAEPSLLEHVHFAGLSAPRGAGWELTGAVTFYRSAVEIRHASFAHNRDSDDALNVVRGELVLDEVRFLDTPSDAVDIDFSRGEIRGCRFERIGGDAVDTSGSAVILSGLIVRGVGDKAVSAGEASDVRFRDLDVAGAALGLASKDDSELRGRGVTFRGGGVGFAAYRKKPEHGPAVLEAHAVDAEGLEELYLLEPGSTLVLDGEEKAANARDLRRRFTPPEEGG